MSACRRDRSKGVERIVEIELAGKDREAFDKSSAGARLVDACKKSRPICSASDCRRSADRFSLSNTRMSRSFSRPSS